ncbi:MAG: hypothetical protein WCB94_03620 [Terriglobales bacterium]
MDTRWKSVNCLAARLRACAPFAYNLLRAHGSDTIKSARWRAAIVIDALLKMPQIRRELK